MMQELIMYLGNDLQALVKGVVVISDNGGVDANIMKQMTPSLAKKMVTIFQNNYNDDQRMDWIYGFKGLDPWTRKIVSRRVSNTIETYSYSHSYLCSIFSLNS